MVDGEERVVARGPLASGVRSDLGVRHGGFDEGWIGGVRVAGHADFSRLRAASGLRQALGSRARAFRREPAVFVPSYFRETARGADGSNDGGEDFSIFDPHGDGDGELLGSGVNVGDHLVELDVAGQQAVRLGVVQSGQMGRAGFSG